MPCVVVSGPGYLDVTEIGIKVCNRLASTTSLSVMVITANRQTAENYEDGLKAVRVTCPQVTTSETIHNTIHSHVKHASARQLWPCVVFDFMPVTLAIDEQILREAATFVYVARQGDHHTNKHPLLETVPQVVRDAASELHVRDPTRFYSAVPSAIRRELTNGKKWVKDDGNRCDAYWQLYTAASEDDPQESELSEGQEKDSETTTDAKKNSEATLIEVPPPPHPVYKLQTPWAFWAHAAQSDDWSDASYRRAADPFSDVRGFWCTYNAFFPKDLRSGAMWFLMRGSSFPAWEHPSNQAGGCWSFSTTPEHVSETWRELCMLLVGETLCKDTVLGHSFITGVSVQWKHASIVYKVWVSNTTHSENMAALMNMSTVRFVANPAATGYFRAHVARQNYAAIGPAKKAPPAPTL